MMGLFGVRPKNKPVIKVLTPREKDAEIIKLVHLDRLPRYREYGLEITIEELSNLYFSQLGEGEPLSSTRLDLMTKVLSDVEDAHFKKWWAKRASVVYAIKNSRGT